MQTQPIQGFTVAGASFEPIPFSPPLISLYTQSSISSSPLSQNADSKGCCYWILLIPRKICSVVTFPFRALRDKVYLQHPNLAICTNPKWVIDRYLSEGGNSEAENKLKGRINGQLENPKFFTDHLLQYYRQRQRFPAKYRILDSHPNIKEIFSPERMSNLYQRGIAAANRMLQSPRTTAFREQLAAQLERFRREGIPIYTP